MSEFVKPGSIKICLPKEKIPRLPENREHLMGSVNVDSGKGELHRLKKRGLGAGWCALYGDYAAKIAKEKQRLTSEEMRVLFKLLDVLVKVGVENRLPVSHKQIAQEMGLHPFAISRAIRGLRERCIIIEEKPKDGIKTYLLNPYFVYKGSNRQDVIEEFDNLFSETKNVGGESVWQATNGYKSSKNTVKVFATRDTDTGELNLYPLKDKNLGIGWCALYGDFAAKIANMRLSNEEMRILFELLAKVDFENHLTVTQKELVQETGIHCSTVSKAMKELRKQNIIVEERRLGSIKFYRLNPFFAHKGRKRENTIKEFNKLLDKKRNNAKK